ncbi:MAG TPA: cytochrome c [Thermodesulfobacteriota bacterium]|nr:cytochrome c [Thermodesulfobacteriota bacterium]
MQESRIVLSFPLFFIIMGSAPTATGQANPLREQMEALNAAFHTMIDSVILENLQAVGPALASVRQATERLEDAVKSGSPVILPKNQNRTEDFGKINFHFQVDLEDLRQAAETGQKKVVRNLVHKLMDGCVNCHERFRK